MENSVDFENILLYLLSEGEEGAPPPPGWKIQSSNLDDNTDEWHRHLLGDGENL